MNKKLHEDIKRALKEDYNNSSLMEKIFDLIVSLTVIGIITTVIVFVATFICSVLVG